MSIASNIEDHLAPRTMQPLRAVRQAPPARDGLSDTAPTREARSQTLIEAAASAFAAGRPREGRSLLSDAASAPHDGDVANASRVLLRSFGGYPPATEFESAGHIMAATWLVAAGQPLTAFSVLLDAGSSLAVRVAARSLSASRPSECALAAVVALHDRNFSLALQLLQEAGRHADELRLEGVNSHIRTLTGELSVQLGHHHAGHAALSGALELSERTGQPIWTARAAVADATSKVLCEGENGDQQVLAYRLALSASPELCDRADLLAATALAAADRWSDAYDLLARLARREPAEVSHLLAWGLLSLLADAATHSGHQEEARVLIARIAVVDAHCECDIELAELLYATAVLSGGATAETCFEVALSVNPHRLPWHHARTSLAYGSWLRRSRRVTESRSHLLEAHRISEALNLPSLTRRTQAELRASGLRHQRETHRDDEPLNLSPQEFAIARYVAQGLTNREIGEALHLSPRTVGSHLYRIFPKLDVTSRNQLAALIR